MSTISITSLFPFRRLKFVDYEEFELGIGSGTVIEFRPDQRFKPICAHCGTKGTSQHSKHGRFFAGSFIGPS